LPDHTSVDYHVVGAFITAGFGKSSGFKIGSDPFRIGMILLTAEGFNIELHK